VACGCAAPERAASERLEHPPKVEGCGCAGSKPGTSERAQRPLGPGACECGCGGKCGCTHAHPPAHPDGVDDVRQPAHFSRRSDYADLVPLHVPADCPIWCDLAFDELRPSRSFWSCDHYIVTLGAAEDRASLEPPQSLPGKRTGLPTCRRPLDVAADHKPILPQVATPEDGAAACLPRYGFAARFSQLQLCPGFGHKTDFDQAQPPGGSPVDSRGKGGGQPEYCRCVCDCSPYLPGGGAYRGGDDPVGIRPLRKAPRVRSVTSGETASEPFPDPIWPPPSRRPIKARQPALRYAVLPDSMPPDNVFGDSICRWCGPLGSYVPAPSRPEIWGDGSTRVGASPPQFSPTTGTTPVDSTEPTSRSLGQFPMRPPMHSPEIPDDDVRLMDGLR